MAAVGALVAGAYIAAAWACGAGVNALLWGAGIYLVHSQGAKVCLLRHHNAGLKAVKRGEFEEGYQAFMNSYSYLTKNSWIDRWRAVTVLSPSAPSYREMALLNAAFAVGQQGRQEAAIELYRRTLVEFPESPIATTALRLLNPEKVAGHGPGAT